MPRPKLTPEERQHRKRENDKRYYQKHKDNILERQRERYDPLARFNEYHMNAEEICEKRRERYAKGKCNNFKSRLEDLQEALESQLKPITEYLLQSKQYETLTNSEITLIENIVLKANERLEELPENTNS